MPNYEEVKRNELSSTACNNLDKSLKHNAQKKKLMSYM